MKRLFSLLAVLFFFTVAANSQVIVTSTSAYTDVGKSTRVPGWIIRGELGGETSFVYDLYTADVLVNAGYQINPAVYVGGGMGLLVGEDFTSIPIYANSRLYLTNAPVSIYSDLRLGFFVLENLNLFCRAGLGINYKQYDIGVSVNVASYSSDEIDVGFMTYAAYNIPLRIKR